MESKNLKLYAVLLGGREKGYLLEQHKYLFCVVSDFEEVKIKSKEFWRQAINLHIDAYICLKEIYGHEVIIQDDCNGFEVVVSDPSKKLFFANLGGYCKDSFSEVHKQIFVIASGEVEAKILAKSNPFFHDKNLLQEKGCKPHVDDVVSVDEMLSGQGYSIKLEQITFDHLMTGPEVVITGFMKI